MAFATEMLMQFAREGYSMIEIPTTYKHEAMGKPNLNHLSLEFRYLAQYLGDLWMRKRLDNAKRIGRKIGLNDEKGYAVAIFLALLIVSVTIAGYYVWFRPPAEPYNALYLLDAQKKTVDYPGDLVVESE